MMRRSTPAVKWVSSSRNDSVNGVKKLKGKLTSLALAAFVISLLMLTQTLL